MGKRNPVSVVDSNLGSAETGSKGQISVHCNVGSSDVDDTMWANLLQSY